VRLASELGLALACFAIAATLLWFGRRNSDRLSQNGLVFVGYPVVILTFLAIGGAALLTGLLR